MLPSGSHRRFVVGVIVAVACLGLVYGLYLAAGHRLIETAYAHNQRTFLRNIIPNRDIQPLDRYLAESDRLVARFLWLALAVIALVAPGPFCDRWMARLYGGTLRACDWLLAHKRLLVLAGGVGVAAGLSWLAIGVLQAFPNSGDEYCYLYQAMTWRDGRLWNPAHPLQEFFSFYHIRVLDGRVFSVYPPGWPFVLFLAMLAGVPAWLVNPLVATLSLFVLFALGRRLFDERVALLTVGTMCLSSFFLFNSASYFSHPWCLLLTLLFVSAALRAMKEDSWPSAVVAGACFAAMFLTRFYSAILCALPFAAFFLARHRARWRLLPAFAVGGLPLGIAFLWYNHALTGSAFSLPMSGFETYTSRWLTPALFNRAIEIVGANLVSFVAWTPPALLFLLVGARSERRDFARGGFATSVFWCLVAGYFVYVVVAGNEYGPRYYYEALPFVAMLTVWLVFREQDYGEKTARGRWQFYLFAVSAAAAIPLFAWHAAIERQVIIERTDLYRRVADDRIANALVFISTPAGSIRPMPALDLTRNGIDDTGTVLYVHDLGDANRSLMSAYPRRISYRYSYDPDRREGALVPYDGR